MSKQLITSVGITLALLLAIGLGVFGLWKRNGASSFESSRRVLPMTSDTMVAAEPSRPEPRPTGTSTPTVKTAPAAAPPGTVANQAITAPEIAIAEPLEPAPASSATSEQVIAENEVSEATFGGELKVAHLTGVENESRSFTQFQVGASYRLTERSALGVRQDFLKLYEIAPQGEGEMQFEDTLLYYSHKFKKAIAGADVEATLATTVPVSESSRTNHHITRPALQVAFIKQLWEGVSISATPAIHYFFNRFATSPDRTPLKKAAFGQSLTLSVGLIPGIRWVSWGKGYAYFYEEYDDAAISPGISNDFAYGSFIDLELRRNFSIQLGYVRGNSILAEPLYVSSFADAIRSRAYVGLQLGI